ncbi:MAG: (2Fe-2S) ferredoxin domain-containing protein [Rhodospirillales bacterium]|nr:(2Fe-2S) ferredoxin domain-containing protein [Rhodospirillales bacterium]
MDQRPNKILICVNRRFKDDEPSCAARGGFKIAEAFEKGVLERRIDIAVERFICFGQCQKGPTIKLVPGNFILGASLDMVDGLLGKLEAACGTKEPGEGVPPVHLLGS